MPCQYSRKSYLFKGQSNSVDYVDDKDISFLESLITFHSNFENNSNKINDADMLSIPGMYISLFNKICNKFPMIYDCSQKKELYNKLDLEYKGEERHTRGIKEKIINYLQEKKGFIINNRRIEFFLKIALTVPLNDLRSLFKEVVFTVHSSRKYNLTKKTKKISSDVLVKIIPHINSSSNAKPKSGETKLVNCSVALERIDISANDLDLICTGNTNVGNYPETPATITMQTIFSKDKTMAKKSASKKNSNEVARMLKTAMRERNALSMMKLSGKYVKVNPSTEKPEFTITNVRTLSLDERISQPKRDDTLTLSESEFTIAQRLDKLRLRLYTDSPLGNESTEINSSQVTHNYLSQITEVIEISDDDEYEDVEKHSDDPVMNRMIDFLTHRCSLPYDRHPSLLKYYQMRQELNGFLLFINISIRLSFNVHLEVTDSRIFDCIFVSSVIIGLKCKVVIDKTRIIIRHLSHEHQIVAMARLKTLLITDNHVSETEGFHSIFINADLSTHIQMALVYIDEYHLTGSLTTVIDRMAH